MKTPQIALNQCPLVGTPRRGVGSAQRADPTLKLNHFLFALLLAALVQTAHAAPVAVKLNNFKLDGDLAGNRAAFTLTVTAKVTDSHGGSAELLVGPVALTGVDLPPRAHLRADGDKFIASFDHAGEFPIRIQFSAAVVQADGWDSVDFHVAPGVLQPMTLQGLAPETQFHFAGGSRPEQSAGDFVSILPPDGAVKFSWKEVRPETAGKLFFSTEMLSQVSVSPGLMRQVALLNFKVMQGTVDRVTLLLHGAGEVTRVQGEPVLAWNVEPVTNSADRRLVIHLNQPQKDQFSFQVQAQTPLGAFPQSADVMQLKPENATGFAGYFRVVNEGAVRLEVTQASGMSQISPEQIPGGDAAHAAFQGGGNEQFAYRFAGADFALRIQADQILPEVGVSEQLTYNNGGNELSIDCEFELDIREAPLRELLLRIPKGYNVARVSAAELNDYFPAELPNDLGAGLRLIFGQPLSGRQLVALRLERNQGLGETNWALPRVEVLKAKTVRGFIGVSADAGFRMTPERTVALTEMAPAFFPGKPSGIQSAFRINDAPWEAVMRVERLPQTVQADVLHLFSIGEGIAYGSSVINYVVSGAPMAAFKVELSDEYFNVEFTGKDIRNNWQKTAGGYIVQLNSPVSGAYTLLATYERPFKSQGETLAFTGARPLDAQTEQGYTVITSAYQFKVKPAEVSPGLLPLEPGEAPAEYRLFYDAPVLAAYRYGARPFNLKLSLSPLAQGDSLNQIVDRASLETRVSKEGQVITSVRYFIKNRGNPHFRLAIPDGSRLWSASINGAEVVPVSDGKDTLIPLPQSADPDAALELDLKLASQSSDPKRITVAAPAAGAPVMLAEWKIMPDTGRRLVYQTGSLMPEDGELENSGFAQLARLFSGVNATRTLWLLIAAIGLTVAAVLVWRWAADKSGFIRIGSLVCGLAGLVGVAGLIAKLADSAATSPTLSPIGISFLAPVQQANSALSVTMLNVPETVSTISNISPAWPALLAIGAWFYAMVAVGSLRRFAGWIGGWTFLAWAALRTPNGVAFFFWIVFAYLVIAALPALRQILRTLRAPSIAAAPAATAILILCLACDAVRAAVPPAPSIPDSVRQTIRVEDGFVLATAKIHWQALKGQKLPLLNNPAVLTHITIPARRLELVPASAGSDCAQELVARENGAFDIEAQYELRVPKDQFDTGFDSPIPYGLINQVTLTVVNLDVDVLSAQAVAIDSDHATTNTVSTLVLTPDQARITWRPRQRDVKNEKPVFYADISQLYVPAAGVIEAAHFISIRPAQGELGELTLRVPAGATITDVTAPLVSLWRFDPDTRKLRVTLKPVQSKPFTLLVRSQFATGSLPFEKSVGLVAVDNAAGQIGLAGIATGNEVQLDSVNSEAFSPINLEDFPVEPEAALQAQIPGLTLRRAFRYSDTNATAALKASAVEPDVRVETQDTLSLGEDHTVLAATFAVGITRAGIFDLSFVMPAGYDVETISGDALSQWTELKTAAGRIITLHLTGKTLGQRQFFVTLSGPGVKTAANWKVPQIALREAGKQHGTLLIVPEQGMRLQATAREGCAQLDPQKAGIRQKGALAFHILQAPADISLDVEQVEAWIQVTGLQHIAVGETQLKTTANLLYQIENTGLKSFHVFIPADATGARFEGDQVGDSIEMPAPATNVLREWEIKLRRRVIGSYLLQVTYQIPMPAQAAQTTVRGILAADANLQRGFVTVQSDPRLQVTVDHWPDALQPAEWQSIPRALQKDLQTVAADFTCRLVEPSFELPLKLERHEAAQLLPAHVNNITFDSVVSDAGVMLTQAKLEIRPGDKRLLGVLLPKDAHFWFAFVNDSGVWPWRDGDNILVPLEQRSDGDKPATVEIFYSCRPGPAGAKSLDLDLPAPKFDLPLENITWRVWLDGKWNVKHWDGSLQLAEQYTVNDAPASDLNAYLENENSSRQARTAEAREFMDVGNRSLEEGRPGQARRAFEAACGLSTPDAAFNEDARVQLHNIKLQQALLGLNARQSAAVGDTGALGNKLRELRNRKDLDYTQQAAKDIIDNTDADESAAFMRLAEKLVQQQDAAVNNPAAIRANIPEQGRVLSFKRAVAVDPWADLRIGLQASIEQTAPRGTRLLILGVSLAIFALFGLALRKVRNV